jgi:hypothetical protein
MDFKFTKELKEAWLEALRSGKYTQYGGTLMNLDNPNEMCCLGVLSTLLPNVSISDDGGSCLLNGEYDSYRPFDKMGLHRGDKKYNLAHNNDKSYSKGVRDFSVVIPIIETIPTVD